MLLNFLLYEVFDVMLCGRWEHYGEYVESTLCGDLK